MSGWGGFLLPLVFICAVCASGVGAADKNNNNNNAGVPPPPVTQPPTLAHSTSSTDTTSTMHPSTTDHVTSTDPPCQASLTNPYDCTVCDLPNKINFAGVCVDKFKNCPSGFQMTKNKAMQKSCLPVSGASSPPNVVYFIIDDLRAELPHTGHPHVFAPNIDKLATKSMNFKNAFAQESLCNPSRSSFLTSRRPSSLKIWDFKNDIRTWERKTKVPIVTIPENFKDNGYYTTGFGKIFHRNAAVLNNDAARSFSPEAPTPVYLASNEKCGPFMKNNYSSYYGCAIPDADYPLTPDAKITTKAINEIRNIAKRRKKVPTQFQRPFFLQIGLNKPHLPFMAPQSFYDLYSNQTITPAKFPFVPIGMPEIAWADRRDTKSPYYVMDPSLAIKMRRGYWAATSFVDSEVGKIMSELESLNLTDNTIIVLHSDHGFHLGEQGSFRKTTNFDLGLRVPFLLHVPWIPASWGQYTSSLVELLDVYPTLMELANLTLPKDTIIQGQSLLPLIKAPSSDFKAAVFSEMPRCPKSDMRLWKRNVCTKTSWGKVPYMGYSVRTADWRYNEWVVIENGIPNWNKTVAVELYNHAGDDGTHFEEMDLINQVADPQLQKVVARLRKRLVSEFPAV